jgi:hypothetical protein
MQVSIASLFILVKYQSIPLKLVTYSEAKIKVKVITMV